MINLTWEKNKGNVYATLETYFGLSEERISDLVKKNYPSDYDKQKLVAVVAGLVGACRKGETAFNELNHGRDNLEARVKSGEAILSRLNFSENERPSDIYYRLKGLFNSIEEKGIDIYKTIYMTTLTDGNLRSTYYGTIEVANTESDNRNFDNIYNTLKQTLRLSTEETNAIFEKCPATLIAKVFASNISDLYVKMLTNLRMGQWVTDQNTGEKTFKSYLFFRVDEEYKKTPMKFGKSKMLDEGLISCPSLFALLPQKVEGAFSYVSKKVPQAKIDAEHKAFLEAGNTTMTPFWCKFRILRSWINDNFSILSISEDKMLEKEKFISNLSMLFIERDESGYPVFYDSNVRNEYNFDFLFDNPVSISTMNSIPLDKMRKYARKNIETLETYVWRYYYGNWADFQQTRKGVCAAVTSYLKLNHYALAMDNDKLSKLLQMVELHDANNPDDKLFPRFLKLGKSLFANKHNIDFDIARVFKKLSKAEDIQILELDKMGNWERLEKFVELFCDNDRRIVTNIQKLYHEKLARDGRGNKELRNKVRTLITEAGGWSEIIKDKKTTLSITSEIKSLIDKRFEVEQVLRTGRLFEDMSALKMKESAFSDEIRRSLAQLKRAYSEKRERLNKRYTDVDKLYNYTMMFLERECFDDKEPISSLIASEITQPLEETLKALPNSYFESQQNLFGSSALVVPVAKGMVAPMRELAEVISQNNSYDLKFDGIKVVKSDKSTDTGK